MGQTSSTSPTPPAPSSTSSLPAAPNLPSVEEMRNLTHRILASTSDKLKHLRENLPTLEVSLSKKSDSSKAIVVLPSSSSSSCSSSSLTSSKHPRFHCSGRQLVKVVLGAVVVSVAVAVVGAFALRAGRRHCRQLYRRKVLRAKDGSKREVVVVINGSTPEGSALAISLEQQGFIVFVGVADSAQLEQVYHWGIQDIHPVIVDLCEEDSVSAFVARVAAFVEQQNEHLLIGTTPSVSSWTGSASATTAQGEASSENVSSPSSLVFVQEEEDPSTVTAPILPFDLSGSTHLESGGHGSNHHGTVALTPTSGQERLEGDTWPLFMLTAVIINPHSAVQGEISTVDISLWRRSLDMNVTGTVLVAQQTLSLLGKTAPRLLEKRRTPRLILVSSAITGNLGLPSQSSICASHHAMEAVADSLRREVAKAGIDVVCLKPGIVDSMRGKKTKESEHKSSSSTCSSTRNTGCVLGLFKSMMNPIQLLRETCEHSSTTFALSEATLEAITCSYPPIYRPVGTGSLAYSMVAWTMPRSWVDFALNGTMERVQRQVLEMKEYISVSMSRS